MNFLNKIILSALGYKSVYLTYSHADNPVSDGLYVGRIVGSDTLVHLCTDVSTKESFTVEIPYANPMWTHLIDNDTGDTVVEYSQLQDLLADAPEKLVAYTGSQPQHPLGFTMLRNIAFAVPFIGSINVFGYSARG